MNHQATISMRDRRFYPGGTGAARRRYGFTLVELMVALAISLVVVLAAVAALLSAQRGYASVDSASQLRENARFAAEQIQRQALQAGYQDLTSTTITREEALSSGSATDPAPDVIGYDDALVSTTSLLAPGSCGTDTACVNHSDELVLRYYGSSEITAGSADDSMINCAGIGEKALADADLTDRAYSIFYVAMSAGEPTLMCAYKDDKTFVSQPLVGGVEDFQVLYGVDGVNADGTLAAGATGVPTRWMTATQIGATNNKAWRLVRRIRIGMVLRGPANTSVDRSGSGSLGPFYPLGKSLYSGDDSGSTLTIATADGRLRRTAAFTIYLRNPLNVQ